MQNFIKTIINAIKVWIDSRIKGSTADWNESNKNADSYIKNKPDVVLQRDFNKTASKMQDDIINAQNTADNAQNTADNAQVAADNAQTTANSNSMKLLTLDTLQASMPSVASWRSVIYGNGRFVAVAAGKDIAAYSDDGINWTEMTMPATAGWCSVTYGNGRFVAVTNNKSTCAAYSDDGINWIQTSMPATAMWESVAYGNGRFVAVTSGFVGTAAYSDDGINWIQTSMPEDDWYSVTYGNGRFVALPGNNSAWGVYMELG